MIPPIVAVPAIGGHPFSFVNAGNPHMQARNRRALECDAIAKQELMEH
jgi:hypothetical protein